MRRRRGQSGVQEALEGLLGSMESATKVRESLALAYWKQVVGPQAAAASEPESVRDGVLFVRTRSSVWSHELTFLKSHIMTELNRRIGRPVIKEIVFRAQGVKRTKAPEEPPPDAPTDDELSRVQLLPEEQIALRDAVRGLVNIADEALRKSVAQRMIRDRKLRRWRLEHGWRTCEACTALHNTEETLCPICRLRQ